MQDKKSLSATFSSRLLEAMKNKRMTQSNMAKSLGISQNAVWKWLHKTMPDTATIMKIANTCGVSIGYLIGETDDPTPDLREVGLSVSEPSTTYMGKTVFQEKEAKVLKLDHALPKASSPPYHGLNTATLQEEHAEILNRISAIEQLLIKLIAK